MVVVYSGTEDGIETYEGTYSSLAAAQAMIQLIEDSGSLVEVFEIGDPVYTTEGEKEA